MLTAKELTQALFENISTIPSQVSNPPPGTLTENQLEQTGKGYFDDATRLSLNDNALLNESAAEDQSNISLIHYMLDSYDKSSHGHLNESLQRNGNTEASKTNGDLRQNSSSGIFPGSWSNFGWARVPPASGIESQAQCICSPTATALDQALCSVCHSKAGEETGRDEGVSLDLEVRNETSGNTPSALDSS